MRKILLVTAALAGFTALAAQPAHAEGYYGAYGWRPYAGEHAEWRRHEAWDHWRREQEWRRWHWQREHGRDRF